MAVQRVCNWYKILTNSLGTEPDTAWDLLSNAHSREECLADPKVPPRCGTQPGKLTRTSKLTKQGLTTLLNTHNQDKAKCHEAYMVGAINNVCIYSLWDAAT